MVVGDRPASRKAQAQWRREQLLRVAARVFAQRGIEAATMKDIGEAAGITPGLIHYYFGSKEALIVSVIERFSFLEQLEHDVTASVDLSVREVLEIVCAHFAKVLEEYGDVVTMAFTGLSNPIVRAEFEGLVRSGVAILGSFLEERVASGELRSHDCTVSARALLSALVICHVTESDLDVHALVEILMGGVAQTESRTLP
jgi:AcrR family transcriptional regulator